MGLVAESFLAGVSVSEAARNLALMRALLARLAPHLPPDIVDQPPERYANHFEAVARAYVDSMERVNQLMRAL